MKLTYTRGLLALGCAAAVLPAPSAFAQPAAQGGIEEIVVTAQRREENIQKVPISVTALSNKQLEQKSITDVLSLSTAVPNFEAKPTFSPLEITQTIRGVTQLIPAINTDPAIATYIDGTYYAINAGSNAALIDMQRVEVLKGPQGTLFGRNTVGGALNITTNAPTSKFEGYGKVDLATYDQQTYEAVVNLPLIPGTLDTRFVYQYLGRHDGYGTNLFLHTPNGTINQYYFRGSVLWRPSDTWKVLVSGYDSRSAGHSPGTRLLFVNPGDPTGVAFGVGSREPFLNPTNTQDSITNLMDRFYLKQYGVTGTITGELSDLVTLKSITSYRHVLYTTATDGDGTPLPLVEITSFPIDTDEYTEELQLYGKAFNQRLNWIAGLYFFEMTGSQVNHTNFVGTPVAQGSTGTENTSYAAFAQATYSITDRFRFTGGVRYTYDRRFVDYHAHVEAFSNGPFVACALPNVTNPFVEAACSEPASANFHYTSFTAGFEYDLTPSALLYAKVARGFRSGAFNLNEQTASADPAVNALAIKANTTAVAPEELLSPEIGFKLGLLDNKLRINGAAYYSRYSNIQISLNKTPPGSFVAVSVLTNTGAADIYGGELEVTALLGKLQLDAGLGVTEAAYIPIPGGVSGHDWGVGFGTNFINAPKLSVSVGGHLPVETAIGTLTFAANYSYHSKTAFYTHDPLATTVPASADVTNAYGLLDASITLDIANAPVTLMLWGKNLTDAEYHTSGFELGAFNYTVGWMGPPRTFGGSIKYSF